MVTARKILIALSTPAATALFMATSAAQTPPVKMPEVKTQVPGLATVTTEQLSGEVVKVDGNTLIVKLSDGELRTFSHVPDSRKALIDGKEVGVRDLKPGTKLTATITKTTTPVTVRTSTVMTATVAVVSGPTVILRLADGEHKQYTVKPEYKFIVNGQPATITDLKPGMTVSAEKIVEEPTVEIRADSKVVGQAPHP